MEEKIKKERSPQEVLKRKKMIVFPLFVLAFAAVIWLIFSPSKEEKQKLNDKVGINTNIPQAKANALADSKEAEYEKASAEQQQDQRSKTMQDLAGFFGITKERAMSLENLPIIPPEHRMVKVIPEARSDLLPEHIKR